MQNNYNTHDQNNNSFTPTFFVVPFYILNLSGLTLGFLKVYETIFQFWNKGHNCFLSNSMIKARTGLGITQIKEALNFFENHGQLKRITKGTKRYLIQPERSVEHDCIENIQVAAPPARGGRSTGQEVAAPPATEIKNLNKETNTTTSSSINFEQYKKQEIEKLTQANETFIQEQKTERFKQESLADTKCNQAYEERFIGLDITLEELYQECVDYWSQKDQMVYKARFLTHLRKCPLDRYKKQSTNNVVNIDPNKPTQLDFQEFNAGVKGYDWVGEWIAKQKQG